MQEALQQSFSGPPLSTASALHLNGDAWEAKLWTQELCYIGEHHLCIGFLLWGNQTENVSRFRMCAVVQVRPPAVTWTDSSDCDMLRLQTCKLWTAVIPLTDSSCFLTLSTQTSRGAPAQRTFSLWKVLSSALKSLPTLHQYPENILGDREGGPQNQGREQESANWICYFVFRLWGKQASRRKKAVQWKGASLLLPSIWKHRRMPSFGFSEPQHEGSSDTNPEVDDGRR